MFATIEINRRDMVHVICVVHQILIDNFEKFKTEEVPRKEHDVKLLEQLWNELKVWP